MSSLPCALFTFVKFKNASSRLVCFKVYFTLLSSSFLNKAPNAFTEENGNTKLHFCSLDVFPSLYAP